MLNLFGSVSLVIFFVMWIFPMSFMAFDSCEYTPPIFSFLLKCALFVIPVAMVASIVVIKTKSIYQKYWGWALSVLSLLFVAAPFVSLMIIGCTYPMPEHPITTYSAGACYGKDFQGGSVYYLPSGPNLSQKRDISQLPDDAIKLDSGDRAHFRSWDSDTQELCLGSNLQHVYYKEKILPWADAKTFRVFDKSPRYLISENSVYFIDTDESNTTVRFEKLEGLEASSTELISIFWVKDDKNTVYCKSTRIYGANPETYKYYGSEFTIEVNGKETRFEVGSKGCSPKNDD